MAGITKARRTIKAIDRRLDAVRAELLRTCPPFDQMSPHCWQRAWDSRPGLQGIERSLFVRRYHWQNVRDDLLAKEALAAERRAAREYRKRAAASRQTCPACGHEHYPAAA